MTTKHKDQVIEILSLALEDHINDIFVEYMAHVDGVLVRVYLNGWRAGNRDADKKLTIYSPDPTWRDADLHKSNQRIEEELRELIIYLQQLNN